MRYPAAIAIAAFVAGAGLAVFLSRAAPEKQSTRRPPNWRSDSSVRGSVFTSVRR